MSQDPQLNDLLKWSIENSSASTTDPTSAAPSRPLDPKSLAALFNTGPSDADLMKSSMQAIQSPSVPLDEKLIAFDNFEQLIENIDNANNIGPLQLWTPLIAQLGSEEQELARMAAWCVGTAVQNNVAAQERALVAGVVGPLVELSRREEEGVRKKACYAISSEVRNFQPGLDAVLKVLGEEEKMDAADMEAVDKLLDRLRNPVK